MDPYTGWATIQQEHAHAHTHARLHTGTHAHLLLRTPADACAPCSASIWAMSVCRSSSHDLRGHARVPQLHKRQSLGAPGLVALLDTKRTLTCRTSAC